MLVSATAAEIELAAQIWEYYGDLTRTPIGEVNAVPSPDQFDFTQPITVITNGVTVFDEVVEPDVQALLRWAAIDRDRTAMYGAELAIDVQADQ